MFIIFNIGVFVSEMLFLLIAEDEMSLADGLTLKTLELLFSRFLSYLNELSFDICLAEIPSIC